MLSALAGVWERWKGYKAPAQTEFDFQPTVPVLRQEQFADSNAKAEAQATRVQSLYRSVVKGNNSNVTRDFGTHTEDHTLPMKPEFAAAEVMTASAWQELQELGYGIPVHDPADKKK